MRIAITGANGYIGSSLVKKALDLNYEIIAVDIDNTYIDDRAEYIKVNIFDDTENLYDKMGRPDVLIHLAWRKGFIHNDMAHLEDIDKHYRFIVKMIDCGVKYVSIMGSMHEIGYYEGKIDEDTPCNPLSLYGIGKNALRQSLECLVKDKDVYMHWLRGFYIIGNDERSSSVFGKIIRANNEGKKEFPLNSGKNKYDFIKIDDLCNQIIAASTQNKINGIINICSGKPVPLGERIEQFIRENNLGIKLDYGVFPDRPYDSPIVYGDNKRIIEILSKIS